MAYKVRRWWIFIVSAAIVAGLGWWASQSPEFTKNTNSIVQGRSAYAQLYDAFWRSDDRTSTTLITATLFPPAVVSALQSAEERTVMEQQIVDRVSRLSPQQVSIILTIDSLTGSYTDQEITDGLKLTHDGQVATVVDWQPIVATSRVVNAPAGTASQQGIATFQFPESINWATVDAMKLTVAGLPKTSPRDFIWSGGILAQALP